MRLGTRLLALALVLLAVASSTAGILGARGSSADVPSEFRPAASSSVLGNITGPTILSTASNGTYAINASGGPAFGANGSKVGNLTFHASLSGANLTGVSVSPASGNLTGNRSLSTVLTVGAIAETVTISVEISSTYGKLNSSLNLTYPVNVVVPYVVAAEIVNGPSATVLSFAVVIELDQSPVGSVKVPTLTPGSTYNLTYRYPTLGLSSGEHTFSISLANEHGLVRFANGQTSYSASFYVTSAPPDYTVWYVAGIVAFIGVLFIFASRVAARRRGALRK
jgi:hypothetical protein